MPPWEEPVNCSVGGGKKKGRNTCYAAVDAIGNTIIRVSTPRRRTKIEGPIDGGADGEREWILPFLRGISNLRRNKNRKSSSVVNTFREIEREDLDFARALAFLGTLDSIFAILKPRLLLFQPIGSPAKSTIYALPETIETTVGIFLALASRCEGLARNTGRDKNSHRVPIIIAFIPFRPPSVQRSRFDCTSTRNARNYLTHEWEPFFNSILTKAQKI